MVEVDMDPDYSWAKGIWKGVRAVLFIGLLGILDHFAEKAAVESFLRDYLPALPIEWHHLLLAPIAGLIAWLRNFIKLNVVVFVLTMLMLAVSPVSADERVVGGFSSWPTYVASVGGQATTAAVTLSIEASASKGFKLAGFCVGISNATAAAAVTVTVQRRTTASSGGTALTNEGTGATAISKMDPTDSDYAGIARLGGTPGSGGAVLGQFGFTVGEIAAGTADPAGPSIFCKNYAAWGDKPPTVALGVANGLSINVSAAGAGGLSSGSIDAIIVADK